MVRPREAVGWNRGNNYTKSAFADYRPRRGRGSGARHCPPGCRWPNP